MKFKRDYQIIIKADMNDEVYWDVFRKGNPSAATKDDLQVISEMLGIAKSCIDDELKVDKNE